MGYLGLAEAFLRIFTEAVGGMPLPLAPDCPNTLRFPCFDVLIHFTSFVGTALEIGEDFCSNL